MPRIEHVAAWTASPARLERLRAFYAQHFGAVAGAPTPYRSARRPGFASYFLTFPGGGARLELMALPDDARGRAAGVPVLAGPRVTGDGYYEAVVRDPDGNEVEVMA